MRVVEVDKLSKKEKKKSMHPIGLWFGLIPRPEIIKPTSIRADQKKKR
jgi:hypothetical protein